MLKPHGLNSLMGLVLLVTMLGAIVLGSGAASAHTSQIVSGPSAHHVLADVVDPPPGH